MKAAAGAEETGGQGAQLQILWAAGGSVSPAVSLFHWAERLDVEKW